MSGAGGADAFDEDVVHRLGYVQATLDACGAKGADGGSVFVVMSSVAHGPGGEALWPHFVAKFEKEFRELEKLFPVFMGHGVGSLDSAFAWKETQVFSWRERILARSVVPGRFST